MRPFNWLVQSCPRRKVCRGKEISVSSFNLFTLGCVDRPNPAASQASGNFAGEAVARQTSTCFSLKNNEIDRKELINRIKVRRGKKRNKEENLLLFYIEAIGNCCCSVRTNSVVVLAVTELHSLHNVCITHWYRGGNDFVYGRKHVCRKFHFPTLLKILHNIFHRHWITVSCKVQYPLNVVRSLI